MKTVPVYGKKPNCLLGRGGDLPQQRQTWLSCDNVVIVAVTFLPVSWRMWPVPALCSSGVPCRKVQGSQAAHWGRQNPDSSGATALRATHHPQRDVEMSLPHVPNQSWTSVTLQDQDHGAPQSYLWLRLHQAALWGALSNFYLNKKSASYIAHTPTYLPGCMGKVNSERFYVPLVWLETLCFNTSTGSQGRNKVFSFQSAWTWHLLHEGFLLFVLRQLHFNSVQQCWKTWQNIPQCLISMNEQTLKS